MNANDIVLTIVAALDQLHIPYMLVGSYSSNFYGVARATLDADIVLRLENRDLSDVIRLLGPGFRLDPQMSFETITATTRYDILHMASSFRIELFLIGDDPHDRERFARRIHVNIAGRTVFLPTPEDVIVTKLLWSKGGDRAKDIEDVAGILAVQSGHLDLAYIRHWTDLHATRDLFEGLLATVLHDSGPEHPLPRRS